MFKNLLKKADNPYTEEDKYGGHADTIENACYSCRWWHSEAPLVCEAFPEGIPMVILLGYLDHKVPFEDEDLVYEERSEVVAKKDTGNFADLHPRYPSGHPNGGKFMPKGSPEYNAAIADAKASVQNEPEETPKKEKPFSAEEFSKTQTGSQQGNYEEKDKMVLLKEGDALAKKFLSKEGYAEFTQKMNELNQDILDKKETFHQFKDDKENYSPERLAVHNEIMSKIFKNADKFKPKEGEKPEFILLGGPGGAGKSQFGEDHIKAYDPNTHLKLDNDEIKTMLPNYNPEKAFLFHKEAGDILDKVLARAKDMGLNTILDATMRTSEAATIKDFKAHGYSVATHFMHVSPQESAGRALYRWLNVDRKGNPHKVGEDGKPVRGRLVPPNVVLGMVSNWKNFDEAKGMADKWSLYRNDHPSGVKATKVASSDDAVPKKAIKSLKMILLDKSNKK